MCGRFTIVPTVDFHERFGLAAGAAIAPRYNVAPGQKVPIIVSAERNQVVPMIWGFDLSSVKDSPAGRTVINARAETLLSRHAFRSAVRSHRCLVPASGFYEWKEEGARRIPFYLRLPKAPLFSFAGLYGTRRDPGGDEIPAFTIVTTEPNRLVARLHDRMPAILPQERERDWLGPNSVSSADLEKLLVPYPAEEMEAYPVSGRVNDPGNEGPDLIRLLPGLEKYIFLPLGELRSPSGLEK
jgi:putative SOS response-associated peptidase YedK